MAKVQEQVVPYLTVSDGAGAIAFYKKGLGAKELSRMPAQDGKRLMHAALELNGHTIYLADDLSDSGGRTPDRLGGTPVALHLRLTDPKDVDRSIAKAVKAGAKITMEAADQFWGDRFGVISDPFGHSWQFGAPLPKPRKALAPKKKAKRK